MTRPSEARIDLEALRHNAGVARVRHGGRQLAVLKANAYGHGAVTCALALRGTSDGFAVAFLDEARALRTAGVREPILVLEGVFDDQELKDAVSLDLWVVVHHEEQLRMLERSTLPPHALQVWLKVDSGMRRVGVAPAAVRDAYTRLLSCGKVASVALMTHFARADEHDGATLEQLEVFDRATEGLRAITSVCNSAGILGWPQARRDWARPGIMLYGADPMPEGGGNGLRPVMTLASQVIAERWLATGESLGYGAKFIAETPTRVGVVAIGYADGYPRTAPTGTPVSVDGHLTRTLGRVSMDMLFVDLTNLAQARLGSSVELWGTTVNINGVASRAGTLSYELLCNVKRVPLRYTGSAN